MPTPGSTSAIEPMIGHAKNDGRLGRNHLLGHDGDRINALLAAAGHNLRLILNKLRLLFARILAALLAPAAKPDTWPPLPSIQISTA
jgi:IS5 family transposase